MTTFAELNLNPDIFKALDACGYKTPTPIQQKSIPSILMGKDIVASAQTGTGKTAAFVLPALHHLSLAQPNNKPRILILTPTRELATQINLAATKYGKFLRFRIASLVGGMPYRQQLRDLSRSVDIIVATPGRLLDHMENHHLDLSAIEMLILDEADRMLDMGFIDDVREIASVTSKDRQTLLFSATVDDKLSHIVRQLLKDPIRIDLSQEKLAPTQITQKIYLADNQQHKTKLLQHFLQNESIYKAIIFSATKINADNLSRQLREQGFAAAALHGDLKQGTRNKTIDNLRRGKIQYLVATDVAARGIDINDVTHVINYDLPKFSEDYVHRIGRTGRAGRTGIAISFASPVDARHLQRLERYMGQKLEFATVDGLEPTKGISMDGAKSNKKKKYGQSNQNKRGGERSTNGGSRFARRSDDEGRSQGGRGRRSESNDTGTRSFGEDSGRPRKSYSNNDSAPRSFGEGRGRGPRRNDSDESGVRSFREGGVARPRSAHPRDSAPRSYRDSETRRSAPRRADSGERSYRGDSARGSRSEGAPRSYRDGDSARGSRNESAPRAYRSDSARGPRGDSAPRSYRDGDSARGSRGDNAPRSYRSESTPRTYRSDSTRGPRRDSNEGGARPARGGRSFQGTSTRRPSGDKPRRSSRSYV